LRVERSLVVALLAASTGIAGDVSPGAFASARASCGPATPLKGAPILQLGPVRVAGFSSARCAWIRLGCEPVLGNHQAPLSLELSRPPKSPIVLRVARSDAVKFVLLGSTTPAPKVPRCLPARRTRAKVSLEAPKAYFVLFVFARGNVTFHLSAWRGDRQLGSAVISAARA
jgi:hypothetical protein